MIARELVKLNTVDTDPNGFPIGREYRAFVYKNEVVTYGFYWDEYGDSASLQGNEKRDFIHKITLAAKQVNVPFISVDVAQLETGEWTIIEIGDGQFSGLSQIPVLELWSKVKDFTL